MVFLQAFGGVFSLIIVVILGYWLAAKGWFDAGCRKMLPKLVTNVCLPPFLASTIINYFPRENLDHIFAGTALPFLSLIALFVLAWLTAKLIKVNKKHFGLFCACISNPNTIFIGIPVNLALFGTASTPYVLLFYFASTTFFWTIGNYFISRDQSDNPQKQDSKIIHWQRIFAPPIIGFIIGMIILILKLPVPEFIMRSAMLIGELTTPLALIFIGITLQQMGLLNLRLTRDINIALLGRLVISPLLMWLCVPLFNLPELMGKVFVIQAALPVILQIPILSAYYQTDPEFGTMMVSLSTILCVVTVPVWMCVL